MKKKKIRKLIKKAEIWGKLLETQRIQNEKESAETWLYNLEEQIHRDVENSCVLSTDVVTRTKYIKDCVSSRINTAVKQIRKDLDEQ